MAKENVTNFIEKIDADEELVKKINELLADAGSEDEIAEKLAAFSVELGLPFTAEEYKQEHQ